MAVLTSFLQVLWSTGDFYLWCTLFCNDTSFFSTFFQLNGQPIEDHSALLMVLVKSKIQDFFHDEMGQYCRYSSPSFQFLCSFRLPSLRVIYPKCYKIFVCSVTKISFNFDPKKYTLKPKLAVFSLKSTETLILSMKVWKTNRKSWILWQFSVTPWRRPTKLILVFIVLGIYNFSLPMASPTISDLYHDSSGVLKVQCNVECFCPLCRCLKDILSISYWP